MRPLVRWALVIGAWLLLTVLSAPELHLFFVLGGSRVPFRETLTLAAVNAGICALFLPVIVYLTRRVPFGGGRWLVPLAVHVPACVAFSIAHTWLYWMICFAAHDVGYVLFFRFQPNLLTYWAVVGISEAFTYFERFRARERELTRAELDRLRAQLHPHFLFNTLHTISAMMHEDVPAADRTIARLSDLLRRSLENIGRQEVTLQEEVDFVSRYAEIERERFGNGLRLTLETGPGTLDAMVPTMLLQPLVENAVRHGFGPDRGGGEVTIRSALRGDRLSIQVVDDGRGLRGAEPAATSGIGLANLQRRLAQLYPGSSTFALENRPEGGAVASVEIPYVRSPHALAEAYLVEAGR
jgi:two-component sensor histidine kinase